MNSYEQRDKILLDMGFTSYAEYLESKLWARIRRRVYKVCQKCPCGKDATEIHHRSYKRQFLQGRGKIFQFLTPVCRECHEHIEFDGERKTSLDEANSRLDKIREKAEAKKIRMPPQTRTKPKKKKHIKKKRHFRKTRVKGTKDQCQPGLSSLE